MSRAVYPVSSVGATYLSPLCGSLLLVTIRQIHALTDVPKLFRPRCGLFDRGIAGGYMTGHRGALATMERKLHDFRLFVVVALSRHRGGGATKARSERGGYGRDVARLTQGCYKANTAKTISGPPMLGFRKGRQTRPTLPRRISELINYHTDAQFFHSK